MKPKTAKSIRQRLNALELAVLELQLQIQNVKTWMDSFSSPAPTIIDNTPIIKPLSGTFDVGPRKDAPPDVVCNVTNAKLYEAIPENPADTKSE